MTFLKLALAIIEAIPILDKWFQELQLQYLEKKAAENDVDYLKATELARVKGDTRAMARELGKLTGD